MSDKLQEIKEALREEWRRIRLRIIYRHHMSFRNQKRMGFIAKQAKRPLPPVPEWAWGWTWIIMGLAVAINLVVLVMRLRQG